MRLLATALLATTAGFSTAHAADAKASPFSNKSFGDGGGYKHPDAEVGQYIEEAPKAPADAAPKKPAIAAKVVPEPKPAKPEASRPRPRPFAPAPAAAKAVTKAEPQPAAKTELKPAAASEAAPKTGPSLARAQADVAGVAEDAASEEARRDYETRLLGAGPGAQPARPGLDGGPLLAPAPEARLSELPASATEEGMLFVSLELDPKEAGSLRDAVAGLGAAAAFRPDPRFQALAIDGGGVRISGWVPASRLADAITRRGVTRVSVERGARPAADTRVWGDFQVRLRVTDPTRSEEAIAESVRSLTNAAGFKLDRIFGVETAPQGGQTALVSGSMPLSQLARALSMPGVIEINAALPAEKPAAPVEPPARAGFLKFVMNRGLWLVLLTILLAGTTVGGAVRNALTVFVPYR